MQERAPYLLPQCVVPEKYRLWLMPDFSDFTFTGIVLLSLDVREPTRSIVLHAADLEIFEAHLLERGVSSRPVQVTLHPHEERAVFTFEKEVPRGHIELLIAHYKGRINDDLNGLYKSTYTLSSGETRVMIATQCEALDFRRICPSVDEPAAKAVIDLAVLIPENLTAISNMPVAKKYIRNDGKKWIFFDSTPMMSTYLFALMVGEFEGVESRTKDGTLVRVLATPGAQEPGSPGKREQGLYALQEAVRMIEYYTEYFGMPFPLPKYDLIAIPDFAADAMENWGANTFRETALLVDPAHSSAATRERIADVIYHEGGHQWHGNLVTMYDWSGLWLNEGFATWLELLAGKKFYPEWNPENKFVTQEVLTALAAAALKSSRPIHVDITRESEINEAFDGITYSMGACVIRMLENYVGSDVFRLGLEKYMRDHAYGNASPEDLWDAIEQVSGKSVRKMMDPWIHQTGYPMISVSRIYDESGAPHGLKLVQERFVIDQDSTEEEGPLWTVPVGVIAERSAGSRSYLVLDTRERKIAFADLDIIPAPDEWIKLNASHTGFFRVRYEPNDLRALVRAMGDGALTVPDRIELIDDTFALTRAGHSRADELLDLLNICSRETDLEVWGVILPRLGMLEILASLAGEKRRFRWFKKALVRDTALRLGWDENPSESHQARTMRGPMLSAYGTSGDETTIEEAYLRFAVFSENHDSLNPNLRRAVYGMVASVGGFELQESLRELYKKFSTLQEEQNRLLGAMTEFQDPALLARTLEYFISGEVRTQNVFLLMGQMAANHAGADLTWQFMKDHWDVFVKMYEKSKMLGRLIEGVCSMLVGPEYEDDVRAFFSVYPVEEAERSIAQSLERIRVNTRWLARDGALIASWLRGYYPQSDDAFMPVV